MTSAGEAFPMLVSFLFYFVFLFVWIPFFVIRFEDGHNGLLDKLFVSLTHSTLFFMILVHLLIVFRLLETFTLIGLIVVAFVLLSRYYSKSESMSIGLRMLTTLFDLSEERGKLRQEGRNLMQNTRNKLKGFLRNALQSFRRHPLIWFSYTAVFGVTAADRFSYAFEHVNFAMPDTYTHLAWSKYMSNMDLYMDGVYPYGFEAIVTAMSYIFHIDMYVILRFIGPIVLILTMLSVVFALRRIAKRDHLTIALALFLMSFSAAVMVNDPFVMERQMAGLSMEYTAVFLFPGIVFFHRYFKTDKRTYLILAAECYCISALGHPFVTVALTLAYLAIGIPHILLLFKKRRWLKILAYMGVAGFIGILPPLIGWMSGKPFHGSSVDYIQGKLDAGGIIHDALKPEVFAVQQPYITGMSLIFVVFLAGFAVCRVIKNSRAPFRSDFDPPLIAGLFLCAMIAIMLSRWLQLPTTIPFDRQPVFLSLSIVFFFGIYWPYLFQWMKWNRLRKVVQVFASFAIVFVMIWSPDQRIQSRSFRLQQYDEPMRAYLDIKARYPLRAWDIISPVDELGAIIGYGYHTELWEFIRDVDDPAKESITFLNPNVFLFVEKVPLDILNQSDYRKITKEEAEMDFPVLPEGQPPTEFYYWYNLQNRRILEAKAYYWAEEYMLKNSDMKVFMETENYKIYEINQNKDKIIINKDRVAAE